MTGPEFMKELDRMRAAMMEAKTLSDNERAFLTAIFDTLEAIAGTLDSVEDLKAEIIRLRLENEQLKAFFDECGDITINRVH